MSEPESNQITRILEAINAGDEGGVEQLFRIVYDQLRKMARTRMAREPNQTLQTTALVHEVYLRLLQDERPQWQNRGHFFAVAAEAMRRILVESARRRTSLKRGGDHHKVSLNEDLVIIQSDPSLMISFDQALTRLQGKDPAMSNVVKLRCFAGLTVKETALALGMSMRNVDRSWAAAKAWLYREMARNSGSQNRPTV